MAMKTMRRSNLCPFFRLWVLALLIGGLSILTSCSMPVEVVLVNDSGREIIVHLFEHKRTIPARGSSEFPFAQFFENGKIRSANVAYSYSMAPLPPRELMLKEKRPEKFALSFAVDGTLRLLKLLPSGATEPLAEQPAGYPLKPR